MATGHLLRADVWSVRAHRGHTESRVGLVADTPRPPRGGPSTRAGMRPPRRDLHQAVGTDSVRANMNMGRHHMQNGTLQRDACHPGNLAPSGGSGTGPGALRRVLWNCGLPGGTESNPNLARKPLRDLVRLPGAFPTNLRISPRTSEFPHELQNFPTNFIISHELPNIPTNF